MIMTITAEIIAIRCRNLNIRYLMILSQYSEIAVNSASADLIILSPYIQVNLIGSRMIASCCNSV